MAAVASKVSTNISKALGKELLALGEQIVKDAKQSAPVDTGYLRDHIAITSSSDREVKVESQADYSVFVEYGTRYMQAQPFFEPAVRSAISKAQPRMASALKSVGL